MGFIAQSALYCQAKIFLAATKAPFLRRQLKQSFYLKGLPIKEQAFFIALKFSSCSYFAGKK